MKRIQFGFTLVELIITLTIAGILTALASPSFTATIRSRRLAGQANDIVTGFNLARNEANKRGINVTICCSADRSSCGGGSGWETGWIIFTENASNLGKRDASGATLALGSTLATPVVLASDSGVLPAGMILNASTATSTEDLLVVHEALSGRDTLRGDTNVATTVTFNNQGMVQPSNGSIVLCDNRDGTQTAVDSREIIIAYTGQVRHRTPKDRKTARPVISDPT